MTLTHNTTLKSNYYHQ